MNWSKISQIFNKYGNIYCKMTVPVQTWQQFNRLKIYAYMIFEVLELFDYSSYLK